MDVQKGYLCKKEGGLECNIHFCKSWHLLYVCMYAHTTLQGLRQRQKRIILNISVNLSFNVQRGLQTGKETFETYLNSCLTNIKIN